MKTKTKATSKLPAHAVVTSSNVSVYLPAFDAEQDNAIIALAREIVGSSKRQGPILWSIIEQCSNAANQAAAISTACTDFSEELKSENYGGVATRKSELNKLLAVACSDADFYAAVREILLTTGKGLQGAYKLALKAEAERAKEQAKLAGESEADDEADELSAEPTAADSIGKAYANAQQALAALVAALSEAGRDDTAAQVADGLLYLQNLNI